MVGGTVLEVLMSFINRSKADPRLSSTHVSVFLTLLFLCYRRKGDGKLQAFAKEVMPLAKISSPSTYLRCVNDLHTFGYLIYEPSYKNKVGSRITFHGL